MLATNSWKCLPSVLWFIPVFPSVAVGYPLPFLCGALVVWQYGAGGVRGGGTRRTGGRQHRPPVAGPAGMRRAARRGAGAGPGPEAESGAARSSLEDQAGGRTHLAIDTPCSVDDEFGIFWQPPPLSMTHYVP